jgi:cleavage and polyadenylation specificity factor subunit 1
VYATTLAVPADFLSPSCAEPAIPQLLPHMRGLLRTMNPTQGTSWHCAPAARIPPALKEAQFVFLRRDATRTPLQRPYDGPYPVIQHGDKHFQIEVNGRNTTVSIDRLKPACVDPAIQGPVLRQR